MSDLCGNRGAPDQRDARAAAGSRPAPESGTARTGRSAEPTPPPAPQAKQRKTDLASAPCELDVGSALRTAKVWYDDAAVRRIAGLAGEIHEELRTMQSESRARDARAFAVSIVVGLPTNSIRVEVDALAQDAPSADGR